MRSESERAYQFGGLAAATMLPGEDEEDEVFDPASVTGVDELIAGAMPQTSPEMVRMAAMNRDTAIAQLRAAQDDFTQRRAAQQQQAEQDRWLALAQAMLAPTRTGAFGENVGLAAGELRAESAKQAKIDAAFAEEQMRMTEREQEIASDYFDAMVNINGFRNTSRSRVVGTSTVIAPEDIEAVDAGDITEAEANRNIVSIIMNPDGTTTSRVETDSQGRPWRIVDPSKVPTQAAAQKAATVTAGKAMEDMIATAKRGVEAIPSITRLQRAYAKLKGLREDTSGLSEKIREVAQWAGISEVIDENTTLSVLHSMFGKQILADIRVLTGNKTDYEFKKVAGMNANLGKDIESNLGIIDEQLGVLDEMVTKGEFAAQELKEGPGTEEKAFWLEQYLRFREQQAQAAIEFNRESRVAPRSKEEQLIKLYRQNAGNPTEQAYLLDAFEELYDFTDEIRLQLRQLGAEL